MSASRVGASSSWRNGMVLERKIIGKDDDGNPIEVDVVPSIKELIACCKEILDRAVGKASQEIDLKSKEGAHRNGDY